MPSTLLKGGNPDDAIINDSPLLEKRGTRNPDKNVLPLKTAPPRDKVVAMHITAREVIVPESKNQMQPTKSLRHGQVEQDMRWEDFPLRTPGFTLRFTCMLASHLKKNSVSEWEWRCLWCGLTTSSAAAGAKSRAARQRLAGGGVTWAEREGGSLSHTAVVWTV